MTIAPAVRPRRDDYGRLSVKPLAVGGRSRWLRAAAACAFLGLACDDPGSTISSPENATAGSSGANPDGSHGDSGGAGGAQADKLWAVAPKGGIWSRDSEGWHRNDSPTKADLNALWGSGAQDIWAVGAQGVILHYDGATWKTARSDSDGGALLAIHGNGPGGVWAVGDGGTVLHYDGESWKRIASPTTQTLRAVRVVSEDEVWIGGPVGGILEWNGTRLNERAISKAPIVIDGLWHAAGGPIWALGDIDTSCTSWEDDDLDGQNRSVVLRRDARGWAERFVTRRGSSLFTLFGLTGDDVWLWGGYHGDGISVSGANFWNGARIGTIDGLDALRVQRMWGNDRDHLWVVTPDGIVRLSSDGRQTVEGSLVASDLWGIVADDPGCRGDCSQSSESSRSMLTGTQCTADGCAVGVCNFAYDDDGGDGRCECLGHSSEIDGECVPDTGCAGSPCGGHGSCSEVDDRARCECDAGYLPHEPAGCGMAATDCTPQGWCAQDGLYAASAWAAVWAGGPHDVWAVGADFGDEQQMAWVAHRGSGGWTTGSLDGSRAVDVAGTGPSDVWVLSSDNLSHYDGQSWLALPIDAGSGLVGTVGGPFDSLYSPSPQDVWVSGTASGFVDVDVLYHWDGTRWLLVRQGDVVWQNQVCGDGVPYVHDRLLPGRDRASEAQTSLEEANVPPVALEPELTPVGVAIVGPNDVYAVGDSRIAHFDGSEWREEEPVSMPILDQLTRASDGELWAVGIKDYIDRMVGHGDGHAFVWSKPPCDPYDLSAVSSSLVYASCFNDLLRYDGDDWEATAATELGLGSSAPYVSLAGVLATSGDDIWLNGCDYFDETYGSVAGCFAAHWDGSEWHRFDPGESLWRMALDSESGLWAVLGSRPGIARFDGNDWVFHEFSGDWPFQGIVARSPYDAWAVSREQVVHWDGRNWTTERTGDSLYDVWLDGSGRPWVAAGKNVLHLEGTQWIEEPTPRSLTVTRIIGTDDTVWAGGVGPLVWRPLE